MCNIGRINANIISVIVITYDNTFWNYSHMLVTLSAIVLHRCEICNTTAKRGTGPLHLKLSQ